jgi:predicted DNA-binding protein with PD1-like motif
MDEKPPALGVRLEQGALLPDAIEAAAAELGLEFCDVRGFGRLRRLEIRAAGSEAPSRFEGPLDLLQLSGRMRRAGRVELSDWLCVVSRSTDNGVQVLGGELLAAECDFAELSFEPLLSAEPDLPRGVGGEPGSGRAAAASPEPARSREGSLGERWGDVLAESERQQRSAPDWDDEPPEVFPRRNDVVNHRQFGRCKVMKMDDEHITLRKPDGKSVQLGLAVLRFSEVGREGKATVFDVEVRRR